MIRLLNQVFVRQFYASNAGFFLFFFFLFFGAVNGSSLVSYHLSLMEGILSSPMVLLLVAGCWLLYHLKCVAFFRRIINSKEGQFLQTIQCLRPLRQWCLCCFLYVGVYAPVFCYGLLVSAVGFRLGFTMAAAMLFFFHVVSAAAFSTLIYYRLNHWIERIPFPKIRWSLQKRLLLIVVFYFAEEKRQVVLFLKGFSLLLLYIILIWNAGRYDNDSFLLFYLVMLLANFLLPFFAVGFLEQKFAHYRNLPLTLFFRGLVFLLAYTILSLPEVLYILLKANLLTLADRIGYCVNMVASLSLLTAMQYSGGQNREDYVKACFGIFFVSLFFFHVQVFFPWLFAQFAMAAILFINGYSAYQPATTEVTQANS